MFVEQGTNWKEDRQFALNNKSYYQFYNNIFNTVNIN